MNNRCQLVGRSQIIVVNDQHIWKLLDCLFEIARDASPKLQSESSLAVALMKCILLENQGEAMNKQKAEPSAGLYPTTQWTQIIGVIQKGDDAAAHRALAEFCGQYRPAILSFFQQRGCEIHEAEDYTQEFFEARILQPWDKRDGFLHEAERRPSGKFRGFLSTYLWWFIKDKWKERNNQRSGGGSAHVPVDDLEISNEASEQEAFEKFGRQFDRVFALALIQKVAAGSSRSKFLLAHLRGEMTQKEAADKLGISETAFKRAFALFRERFRHDLWEEVSKLVQADHQDIQDEIRYLMSLFAE